MAIEETLQKLRNEKFKGVEPSWVPAMWRDQTGTITNDEMNFYFLKDGGSSVYVEPMWEKISGKPHCFVCRVEIKYKKEGDRQIPYCPICEGEPKDG